MLEQKLLKLLLNRKFYLDNQKHLVREMFPGEFGDIYDTVTEAHKKYELENISLSELVTLHYTRFPALTVATKNNVDLVFRNVANEEVLTEAIAKDVLETCYRREQARQIAQEAIHVINGGADDLCGIGRIWDSIKETTSVDGRTSPVSSDIDAILEGVANNIKWFFNIEPLKRVVPGIGPALFSIIAMRPESGKTALYTHLLAAPGGFAEQGAKIDVIINEEPAIRTKMRAVCAASGLTEDQVRQEIPKVREIWNKIKDNIRMYDTVGLTMEELDAHVTQSNPDILIVDQLDKVRVSVGNDLRSDEKLREIYTGARELAKRRNCAVIGICQLSVDAHNRRYTDFSMLEGSKTGKAAEADLIICGGHLENEMYRQLNIVKNKITGKHDPVTLRLYPQISRYGA